jgi:hypothetical protein
VSNAKGRPLSVCLVIITLWTVTRLGMANNDKSASLIVPENSARQIEILPPMIHEDAAPRLKRSLKLNWSSAPGKSGAITRNADRKINQQSNFQQKLYNLPSAMLGGNVLDGGSTARTSKAVDNIIHSSWPIAAAPISHIPGARRLNFYAYSFWRAGAFHNNAAPAAQYGGSQSGLIATYRLTAQDHPDLAAIVRVATSPRQSQNQPPENEVAIGLRWRPIKKLPVTVSAERRLRTNSADQTALYVAGSLDKLSLDNNVTARGFVQAGIVPDKNPNIFYDASMRLEHTLLRIPNAELHVGTGIWSGGQRGAARIDVGPSIGMNLSKRIDISADWRFRVAGNARPGNGPAVTISAGF